MVTFHSGTIIPPVYERSALMVMPGAFFLASVRWADLWMAGDTQSTPQKSGPVHAFPHLPQLTLHSRKFTQCLSKHVFHGLDLDKICPGDRET
jgi:hypothetical protein